MSEPKLISPMLDNFAMGDPISNHNGVRCCPAMQQNSDKKYIVKIISIPASQVQLNALLLTGAYRSTAAALAYFKDLSDGIVKETEILEKLSKMEGFVPYVQTQIVPMENEIGYDVYLLANYHRTLERLFRKSMMTHLGAVNLGLDLCAAMTVCRQAGYLYVDLKPSNIFISPEQEYRVGDLGFVPLNTLKYASLPDRYRSAYTAPEIKDAFSTLNTTVDIYAIGLVLYQAFNGGTLPFDGSAPEEVLPAPLYADYEIAEIILKACAPKPEDRWQTPLEMGQALVGYMQRNSVNDTPLYQSPPASASVRSQSSDPNATKVISNIKDLTQDNSAASSAEAAPAEAAEAAEPVSEAAPETKDEISDLSFMDQLTSDETAPSEAQAGEIGYQEVTAELSDILNQADDLLNHELPGPVVAPDPIEVPMPAPIVPEEPEAPAEQPEAIPAPQKAAQDEDDEDEDEDEEDDDDEDEDDEDDEDDDAPRKHISVKRIITPIITILIIGLLVVGGYFLYKNFYLQTIDDLQLVGTENQLSVMLITDIDDSLLTVDCVDTFGNKLSAPVVNGGAVFTDLKPNAIYKVDVKISGLHKLVGPTSDSFTTPAQTNIVLFNAVAGSTDGSVMLNLTVDGQKADSWLVTYSAEGEEEKSLAFTGQMVTISGLTTNKEYTFRISSETPLYITGQNELKYTPLPLVYAENLEVSSYSKDTLTVTWTVPEGAVVENWSVQCYNESGYDETQIVSGTEATFTNVDRSVSYVIEVKAEGMSMGRQVYASDNSLTVSNIATSVSEMSDISIAWTHEGQLPDDGWLLMYSVGTSEHQTVLHCQTDSAQISPAIPGETYTFSLQASNGATVFNGDFTVDVPEAEKFKSSFYGLSYDEIIPQLCRTPSYSDWDSYDLSSDDYTSTFKVGEKASILMESTHYEYSSTSNTLYVTCMIRDANGDYVTSSRESRKWYKGLWYGGESTIDLPELPTAPGEYTVTVYYDNYYVCDLSFSVVPN